MPAKNAEDITVLLARWRSDTADGQNRLFAAVHGELRRIAGGYMRRERPDHTLQPSALVNEAFLRLAGDRPVAWEDRAHFYGIAAPSCVRSSSITHGSAQPANAAHTAAHIDRCRESRRPAPGRTST